MRTNVSLSLVIGMLCLASSAPATTLSDADGFATEMTIPTIISATVQTSAPVQPGEPPRPPDGTYCFSVVAEDGMGTTVGSQEECRTIMGSMNDRQIALSWTGVAGAVQYRIYVGKNGLPASLYHSSPTNTFTYRSDYGARPGSVPTTTTAYVTKLSAQGSWIPRLVSRGIGGGLELYGDAGRSPGFHIGGPVRGAYREGVLGFALSGGHWAAAAASGDLVMRVQDGSIHFANQSPAYTPRMTIGSDGVLYITPSNLGTPGHPSLRATQFAIGWNVSNGRGETDFYQDHGDGWQGGYDFYAQSGNSTWLLARLRGNGNLSLVGQLNEGSDAREKTNIQPISNALGTIRDLRGVRFNWKDGKARDEKTHLGLVAQEVLRVVPEVVVADDENDEKGGGEKRYGLHYSGLIPILIEAVKEQQQLIDDLKKRLLEVEARLNGAEPVTK